MAWSGYIQDVWYALSYRCHGAAVTGACCRLVICYIGSAKMF